MSTLSEESVRRRYLHRYENLIQQTNTDLMAIYFVALEANLDQYRTTLAQEHGQMWQYHRQHVVNKEMTSRLITLIDQRIKNMQEKCKVKCDFLVNYHLRTSFGQLEAIRKGRSIQSPRIGFSSNVIIDSSVTHPFTEKQLQLLHRGPTYVAPGQVHLLPTCQSVENRIIKQYAPLQHHLAIIFQQYRVDIPQSAHIQHQAKNSFQTLFSSPLPPNIRQRAVYEKNLIQSIQHSLEKNNLLLRRTADQKNVFYVAHQNDFETHSNTYMNQADEYKILCTFDDHNQGDIQRMLEKKVETINEVLEHLFKEKRFTDQVYRRLRVNSSAIKLPYLYFLPTIAQVRS